MLKTILSSASVIVIPLFAMVASGAIAAPPGPLPHKCSNPVQSAILQEVIDDADEGDVIEVEGDCVGFNYVIATDGLTLRGVDGATQTGDGLASAITVKADDVIIEDFDEIDGAASTGIFVTAAGSASIHDIGLVTGGDGISIIEGAYANIKNVLVSGTADDGIVLATNGTARIENTEILGVPDDGLLVISGGAVNFVGGNTIHFSGDKGLLASGGQLQISGANTIENNTGGDIQCVGFSRIAVVDSVTSATHIGIISPSSCALALIGGPLFAP